eukprot:scaffold92789_cov38-Phaeocystis_antarctica.AAC.1
MRLCRGCAQGGVRWKRVGGRAGARQGHTAQNSGRMFVFAATLVPRRRDIRHGNVGERENSNPRNHRAKTRLLARPLLSRLRRRCAPLRGTQRRCAGASRRPSGALRAQRAGRAPCYEHGKKAGGGELTPGTFSGSLEPHHSWTRPRKPQDPSVWSIGPSEIRNCVGLTAGVRKGAKGSAGRAPPIATRASPKASRPAAI